MGDRLEKFAGWNVEKTGGYCKQGISGRGMMSGISLKA